MNLGFDRIYCVNLDEATERWKLCQEQFDKYQLDVNRVSALKGDGSILNTSQRGNQGLIRTVRKIINETIKDNLKTILILEDDFQFVDGFDILFEKYVKQVPNNWDLLYFGGNHIEATIPISENIHKMQHTYATHSYAMKNTMFEKILNQFENDKLPGDYLIANMMKSINAYVFKPHLSYQRSGWSYIEGREVDYSFLK